MSEPRVLDDPELDAKRRRVLKGALVAPIVSAGLWLGWSGRARAGLLTAAESGKPPSRAIELTAWIRIEPSSRTVALVVSQAELGQGISTTLPAVLADELGADWASVTLQTAPWDPAYRNPKYEWMFTGNSESVQAFYSHMRTVGAAAREMLVAAAAQRWGVSASECRTEMSQVIHVPSGSRLHFGELASAASQLPVPRTPVLRPDGDLRLVGRSLPRVDVPSKVTGQAVFGIDVVVPGMLIAAVRTVPVIGARLIGFDDSAAKLMPGIKAIVPVQNGVAVVAERYWQARRALATIELRSQVTTASLSVDTAQMRASAEDVLRSGPFARPVAEGDVVAALAEGRVLRAVYENPCAAHVTMEPMNCVADASRGRCEIWAPTQGQDLAAAALQSALGLAADQISVNRSPAIGGGFGRRLLPDFIVQAALISKAVGSPVKVIWDREEDMRRDHFRPASALEVQAAVDAKGMPRALDVRLVTPTILAPVFPNIQSTLDATGVDPSAMEGLEHLPYAFNARRVQFHLVRTPLPTSVMRTTGYGPNLFAMECFIDELARRGRIDPFDMRRRLLGRNGEALALLDRLEAISDWRRPAARGLGRGLAFGEAFGSLIGMVVEVRVNGPDVKLQRVSTVVDCGRTLDPGIARAGIEGGVIFGMAFCKAEAVFVQGRLQQDNLATYRLPTLAETPPMQIEFMQSGRALGGVGEIGPVAFSPALANGIFAASGRRLRSMPLARHGMRFI